MMDVVLLISYISLGFMAVSTLVLVFFRKDYYFIYNHRLVFVLGLEFSRVLTDYAIISVIIWYFIDYGDDLVMSAIMTNIQSSLSSFLVIFMAHAADSYVGRFHTLLFSNTAYVGGLMLLWLFNPYDVKWLVVISLVLLSFGTSGANILQDVLKHLVNDIDKSLDRDTTRYLARAAIWSRIAYLFGVISAILWVATDAVGGVQDPSWQRTFLICIITMTATSIIFYTGHQIYHQSPLTKRPAEAFFRVSRAHIKRLIKCSLRYFIKFSRQDKSPKNLETEKIENETIPHERHRLRLDTKGKEAGRSTYNQEDIMVVKRLLRMFPMWGMFFVVSLISATGFTFFLQQYTNLNLSDKIPVQIYNIVQDFSRYVVPFLYLWISGLHQNEKVKIGVGMICGIISCIFAWKLEVYRLKEVKYLVDMDANTSISFLWLVPQFSLLGCMEGLTNEGLLKFYRSQVKQEPLLSYGEEYIEIVMGLGKLINIFLILVFDSQLDWFGDTINDSRLDKYYLVLVYIFSANFIFYCVIAKYFYEDQALANGDQEQDNQVLASGDQGQDDQVLASDYHIEHDDQVLAYGSDQEQDDQVLAGGNLEKDDQVLANDYLEQHHVLANSYQDQDDQVLAEDDYEKDDQVLSNGNQEQDNRVLTNNNDLSKTG